MSDKKDVEMKDDTKATTVVKKDEDKKEEPYDPFFGKVMKIITIG